MPTTDHRHIDIGPHRHMRDGHSDEHSKELTDADDSGGVGRPSSVGPYDREISLRGILGSGIVLIVVTVVSALLMWWMLRAFSAADQRKDPPASPIPAARQQPLPPEPRLQINDKEDMRGLRGREDAILNEPGWVDEGQGRARIPIGVGMEAIVGRGLAPLGSTPPATATGEAPQAIPNPNPNPNNAGQAPGALNQMARPVSPAVPPSSNPGARQQGPSSPPQQ